MTYDTSVWKPSNDVADPTEEFTRRFDESDARYPALRPAIPELVRLADLVEAEFGQHGPWEGESFRDFIDGDFMYITMGYAGGGAVEAFIAKHAKSLGLVVYSPMSEDFVTS